MFDSIFVKWRIDDELDENFWTGLSRVRTAIHSLPEREREVFLLRQNGQLTFQAIAEALDAPLGTVKTRMRSALRRLRRAMDDAPRAMAAVRGGRR